MDQSIVFEIHIRQNVRDFKALLPGQLPFGQDEKINVGIRGCFSSGIRAEQDEGPNRKPPADLFFGFQQRLLLRQCQRAGGAKKNHGDGLHRIPFYYFLLALDCNLAKIDPPGINEKSSCENMRMASTPASFFNLCILFFHIRIF